MQKKLRDNMLKGPLLLTSMTLHSLLFSQYYTETVHPKWNQKFSVREVLYQEKTDYQDLILFENDTFGTVLALDGAIQVTQKDEFIYQEMLTQVPIFTHGAVESVLVIGGGDGGILREALKHPQIKRIVLVELDKSVVDFSKIHLPFMSQGAFEDPRVEIIIEDGCRYVKSTQETFDLIICDSTDPVGEGANLFTPEFYANCHSCLKKGGIFVNQSGVPFLQSGEITHVNQALKQSFENVSFYFVAVPTYVGGVMALGFASDAPYNPSLSKLKEAYTPYQNALRYYTPEVHKAAFAVPKFIADLLCSKNDSRVGGFSKLEPRFEHPF